MLYQQKLGETAIPIRHMTYEKALPLLFIHLHHNEKTAADVADSVSREAGIEFLQIMNNEKRLIDFSAGRRSFRVDPNRIFSREGANSNLNRLSQTSDEALLAIDSFQRFLTSFFKDNQTIVALHNNTDGEFSLDQYQQTNAGSIYKNPELDPDDFFITTDSSIFSQLKDRGYNVVLENITKVADDGSLSIYCGKNGIRYVNIEAQHGHYREQREMIEVILQILGK